MKRKLLAMLLTLAMVVTYMPAMAMTAFAEGEGQTEPVVGKVAEEQETAGEPQEQEPQVKSTAPVVGALLGASAVPTIDTTTNDLKWNLDELTKADLLKAINTRWPNISGTIGIANKTGVYLWNSVTKLTSEKEKAGLAEGTYYVYTKSSFYATYQNAYFSLTDNRDELVVTIPSTYDRAAGQTGLHDDIFSKIEIKNTRTNENVTGVITSDMLQVKKSGYDNWGAFDDNSTYGVETVRINFGGNADYKSLSTGNKTLTVHDNRDELVVTIPSTYDRTAGQTDLHDDIFSKIEIKNTRTSENVTGVITSDMLQVKKSGYNNWGAFDDNSTYGEEIVRINFGGNADYKSLSTGDKPLTVHDNRDELDILIADSYTRPAETGLHENVFNQVVSGTGKEQLDASMFQVKGTDNEWGKFNDNDTYGDVDVRVVFPGNSTYVDIIVTKNITLIEDKRGDCVCELNDSIEFSTKKSITEENVITSILRNTNPEIQYDSNGKFATAGWKLEYNAGGKQQWASIYYKKDLLEFKQHNFCQGGSSDDPDDEQIRLSFTGNAYTKPINGHVYIYNGTLVVTGKEKSAIALKDGAKFNYFAGRETPLSDKELLEVIWDEEGTTTPPDLITNYENYQDKITVTYRSHRGLGGLITYWDSLTNTNTAKGRHLFGEGENSSDSETITETVKVRFDGNDDYTNCEVTATVVIVDNRFDTEMSCRNITVGYEDDLQSAIRNAVTLTYDTNHEAPDKTRISCPEHLDASLLLEYQDVNIRFTGDDYNKPKDGTIKVRVNKAPAKVTVDGAVVPYDGKTHELEIATSPANDKYDATKKLNYISVTYGVDAEVSGFVSIDMPNSPILTKPIGDIVRERLEARMDESTDDLADGLNKLFPGAGDLISGLRDKYKGGTTAAVINDIVDNVITAFGGNKSVRDLIMDTLKDDGASIKNLGDVFADVSKQLNDGVGLIPGTSPADILGIDTTQLDKIAELLKDENIPVNAKVNFGKGPKAAGLYRTSVILIDRNYVALPAGDTLWIQQREGELGFNKKFNSSDREEIAPEDVSLLESMIQGNLEELEKRLPSDIKLSTLIQGINDISFNVDTVNKFDFGGEFSLKDGDNLNSDGKFTEEIENFNKKNVHTLFFGAAFNQKNPARISESVITEPGIYVEVLYTMLGNYVAKPEARMYVVERLDSKTKIECYSDLDEGKVNPVQKIIETYNFNYEDGYSFKAVVTDKNGDADSRLDADKNVDFYYISWDDSKKRIDINSTVEAIVTDEDGNTDEYTTVEPTDAGLYLVVARYSGNLTYRPSAGVALLRIKKIDWTPELSMNSWIYGGFDPAYNTPSLKSAAPEEVGAPTYYYAPIGTANWSKTVPTGVGSYWVKAVFPESKNYKAQEVTKNFSIYPREAGAFVINEIDDQLYTGSAITPELVIIGLNGPLTKGVDYTVEYKNNVEPGFATAVVTFMGNYQGTASVKFRIYGKPESILLAKGTSGSGSSVKVAWNKVGGASQYVVYGNLCGKKVKKLKTTSGTNFTVKKIGGKKLKAHKTYKFYVIALDASGNKIATSKTVHVVTSKTKGKFANVTKVTASAAEATVDAGQDIKADGSITVYKNMKALGTDHAAKLRFVTDNPEVATVSSAGYVTGIRPGTANIYIIAVNGVYTKTVVTIK